MTLSLSNQQLSLPARAAAACVNDQLPIIQINDSEHIYKTFVSPIWDGAITDEQVSSIAPAIQAIAEQANALITGNKLGFAGIISPPKYGVFLIFSYPGDERKQESTAKLVAKSIAEESWWLDSNRHVCRFEAKKNQRNHMCHNPFQYVSYENISPPRQPGDACVLQKHRPTSLRRCCHCRGF